MRRAPAGHPVTEAGEGKFLQAARFAGANGDEFARSVARMTPIQRSLNLARQSLLAYCVGAYPKFKMGAHLRIIADALERVNSGEIKRLLIECPPRFGKSFMVSERFPAWYLGHHPDHMVIFSTYGQDFADRFGRKVSEDMSSDFYKATFPGAKVKKRGATQSNFEMEANGEYKAVGAGGSLTGRGSHLFIGDDLIKNFEEAQSEIYRERLWNWYESTARTRLMPGGAIISMQTRWTVDDLTGRLRTLHANEGWHIITIPAIDADGESSWPEQFPTEELLQTKESVDPKVWWSLYMQQPTVSDGAIFKRDSFWTYDNLPQNSRLIIQSWDTAFKTSSLNDYSVCQTWAVCDDGYYLVDQWRGRIGYDSLFNKAVELASKYSARLLLIEDAASGQSLIQSLQSRTRIPVQGLKPWLRSKKKDGNAVLERDSVAGAEALLLLMKTGKIKLPKGAPWLRDFVDEFCAFDGGNSGHDDQVKAAIVFASYITNNGIPNYSSYQGIARTLRGGF